MDVFGDVIDVVVGWVLDVVFYFVVVVYIVGGGGVI